MFADVHSHVLCGIDDGARDLAETGRLLTELRAVGITHLAFTPHYYPHKRSLLSFEEKREKAYEAVKALPEAENFTFSLGAEVYLGETLFNNAALDSLCYEGTDFMLTELEYTPCFTDAARYRLLRLVEDYSVKPVLAHIDRYPFLWKNMDLLYDLKKMGCYFQVNLSAFKGFFTRMQVMKLYQNGFVDFLGGDVHRSVIPLAEKEKIFSRVEKKYPDFADRISREAVSQLFDS